jgi:hypothetical protein
MMELALGQYMSSNNVDTWARLIPAFKGMFLIKISIVYTGVRGQVDKVVDLNPLAPQRCRFESHQIHWILSCEEAIQLAYGTSVVLLMCPVVPEIMFGGKKSKTSKN